MVPKSWLGRGYQQTGSPKLNLGGEVLCGNVSGKGKENSVNTVKVSAITTCWYSLVMTM
jgi:hypothetical protein